MSARFSLEGPKTCQRWTDALSKFSRTNAKGPLVDETGQPVRSLPAEDAAVPPSTTLRYYGYPLPHIAMARALQSMAPVQRPATRPGNPFAISLRWPTIEMRNFK